MTSISNPIASTPATDRDGDIVVPKGAKFKLPFPLLSQHQHDRPIGEVVSAKATDAGIEIVAKLAKDTGLTYVEMAWKQIKAGLVRGLSIGFRPLKAEPIKGGLRFLEYEIFELSAVTIPANSFAGITSVKQFDAKPVDPEEQLFEEQAKRLDVKNRAAAAVSHAEDILGNYKNRKRKGN